MGRFFGSSGGVWLGGVGGEFVFEKEEFMISSCGRGHQLAVYEFYSVVGDGGTKVLIWICWVWGQGGGDIFCWNPHIVVSVSMEADRPRDMLGLGMAVGGFEGS